VKQGNTPWNPTPAMVEELRALAAAGTGDIEIAAHFGVQYSTIEYWRRRCKIPNGYIRPRKPVPSDFAQIAPTLTKVSCAKHYGVAGPTARRWYRETGIKAALRDFTADDRDIARSPVKRRVWRISSGLRHSKLTPRDCTIAASAQLFLQRFGPVVRASVINPNASGWLMFGRKVSEDDLIAAAYRKGFREEMAA
jgi:hypothetical protein